MKKGKEKCGRMTTIIQRAFGLLEDPGEDSEDDSPSVEENVSSGESEEIEGGGEEEFQAGEPVESWNVKATPARTKQNMGKYQRPPKTKFSFIQKQPLLQHPSQARVVLPYKPQESQLGRFNKNIINIVY